MTAIGLVGVVAGASPAWACDGFGCVGTAIAQGAQGVGYAFERGVGVTGYAIDRGARDLGTALAAASKTSRPNGSRPGTMKIASSVISESTVAASPIWLARVQDSTTARIACSSSVIVSSI